MTSKIIERTDDLAVNRWDYPAVDESAADELKGAQHQGAHLLTSHQLDALQVKAHEEGFSRGHAEGLAAGQTEVSLAIERLNQLISELTRPLQDLDRQVERELLELAVVLASQILRREIAHDPQLIIGAVRDCLDVLPSSARDVTIFLNPEDVGLVTEYLNADGERAWRVQEEGALERGSVRLSSENSQVDGQIRARLEAIVAAAVHELAGADELS